ncbi:MAG: flagellar filament capping protein FliD [Clostridiaceae bacterium]|nr:flagellar filament capping protein FliD [Clostridiaceae bacterium]
MSNTLRITGMASGLDVEGMVAKMVKADSLPLDSLKQGRQIVKWKQDSLRDTLGDINTFKSNYFDLLKSSSYMLSSKGYAGFDVATVDGTNSTAVPSATATAQLGAVTGLYTISNISVATTAKISSVVSNVSQAENLFSASSPNFLASGSSGINIKVNGINKVINISSLDFANLPSLVTDVNTQLNAAGLGGKLIAQASPDGTKLQFSSLTNDSINISDVSGGSDLLKIGYTSTNFDINQSVSNSISDIFGGSSAVFSIQNGSGTPVDFNYDFSVGGLQNNWTIGQVLSDISSKAGVNASYNQLSRTFSLGTNTTGSSSSIKVTENNTIDPTNNFMNKIFGVVDGAVGTVVSGGDAKATITNPQGVTATVLKSTNSFTIDGVLYNLTRDNTTSSTNITITSNTQKTFDKVKDFIVKYNELINKITVKLNEKSQKGYLPLTDEQRKAMSEDEITVWETKAKVGLLSNDRDTGNMLRSLRNAFSNPVTGVASTNSAIGLSTSSDWTQGGKIIIDETKLKAAIENNGQQVIDLLMKQSDNQASYNPNLTSLQKTTRINEEGIFQRLNDVLQDYTRTTRDTSNKKGIFIERAGIAGDFTEFNNLLTSQLTTKDKAITLLTTKISKKENAYYLQFSKLEAAMQAMNSQSSYISQQIGKM